MLQDTLILGEKNMFFKRICAVFAAFAIVASMVGVKADEVENTAAEEPIADDFLLDDCTNFNSAYAHSENLFAYTVPEEDYYAYDTDYSMFRRVSNTNEWVIYEIPDGMYPVFYTYFKYTKNIPHFSFEASYDGNLWEKINPEISINEKESWQWIPVEYSLKKLKNGQKYVKIVFSTNTEVEWSPMLSKVRINYINNGGNGFADCVGTPYESEIAKIKCLGIADGYSEYEFKPYKNVTKAEFAKLNAEILAISDGGRGERVFVDVKSEDWVSGYAAALYRQGIINGDENGRFEPESNISYIQAAKMLVCSLGYSSNAIEYGGYPDGYRLVAKRLGLFDGIEFENENTEINRGECAKMISNSFESGIVYQTVFGENFEYKKGDETLLSKYLDIEVMSGKLNGGGGLSIADGIDSVVDTITLGNKTFKTCGFDGEELLGMDVKCYIKDEIILYAEAVSGEKIRITSDKVIKADNNKIIYEDNNGKENYVSINADTRIVYNGKYKSRVGVNSDFEFSSGYMDIIKNSGKAETLLVWNFTNEIAANSAKLSSKITSRNGDSFELKGSNCKYCKVYLNGEEDDFSEVTVRKNDVVSFAVGDDGRILKVFVDNNNTSGKVSYINTNTVEIDGTRYNTIKDYKKIGGEFSVGEDVVAFFDINNCIFAVERIGDFEYAYLQDVKSGIFNDSSTLRIINQQGETELLNVSDGTRFNGALNRCETLSKLTPQLIRIKRKTDGSVYEIETSEYSLGLIGTEEFTLGYKSDSSKYYGGSLCVFASKYQIGSETPVFIVPRDTKNIEDYEVADRVALITDFDYNAELYDISESYVASVAVIYMDGSRERGVEAYDNTGIIRESEVINNADGEPCLKLTVYNKGEENFVYFDNDGGEDKTGDWLPNYTERITKNGKNPFVAGEVIQYYSDSKSHCRSFRMLLTADMLNNNIMYEKNTGDYAKLSAENYFSELYTAYACVTDRFEDKIMISASDGQDIIRTVPLSGASVYVYDSNRERILTEKDIAKGDMVFVKMTYGDTNEIIVKK